MKMRSKPIPKAEKARITTGPLRSNSSYGNNGLFIFKYKDHKLKVIASDGGGWDHVSVSLKGRCPTWAEMCFVKNIFFDDEETVIQFHPKKSKYVNQHPYTLHLWKNQTNDIELPPSEFVGFK